jgi:serine/threonine protein kinase
VPDEADTEPLPRAQPSAPGAPELPADADRSPGASEDSTRSGPESRHPLLPLPLVLSDRFELLEPIGRGGMGDGYRARDLALRTEVAIKVLSPSQQDPAWRSRLRREVGLAQQVGHPNVCRIFDFFDVSQWRFDAFPRACCLHLQTLRAHLQLLANSFARHRRTDSLPRAVI